MSATTRKNITRVCFMPLLPESGTYDLALLASKATCLWLKNLPKLEATNIVEPYRKWDGKRYRTWVDRVPKNMRSKTFEGIADAIVSQWGAL